MTLVAKLRKALVTFDSSKLAKACQWAKGEYNEAQWTAEVYQMYFLLTNPEPEETGVRRMVRHLFCWSETSSNLNVCLPPALSFDLRQSSLFVDPKIWFPPNRKKGQADLITAIS